MRGNHTEACVGVARPGRAPSAGQHALKLDSAVDCRSANVTVCTPSPCALPLRPPACLPEEHLPPPRTQMEENTVDNQDILDKLPHISMESWAADGAMGCRMNKHGGQGGRMRASFHILALTATLRLNLKKISLRRLSGSQPSCRTG